MYSMRCKELDFDMDALLDFYSTVNQDSWIQREDKLTNLWSMDENNDFDRNHPFYKSIVNCTTISDLVDTDRIYFSRVHPGGMPNHWDYENFTKLQFPVICDEEDGDWSKTPLLFVDKFDQVVEKIDHSENVPIIYSSTFMHGTFKNLENKNDRITLVVDLKLWFGRIEDDFEQGILIQDTPHIRFNSN